MSWREYEDKAASFFRRLGFTSVRDAEVTGARGLHRIDVLVEGLVHGIKFRWVVECKDWKSNIPKEKVMALNSIVQDVGADRGFLLSETGFQSGAIRAAANTNITLSSLADLELEAQATLVRQNVAALLERHHQLVKRLRRLHKATDDYFSRYMVPLGELAILPSVLDDGLEGKFPVSYTLASTQTPPANNWEELVRELTAILNRAERTAAEGETNLGPI